MIASEKQIREFVGAHDRLHVRGLGSKPALHQVDAPILDMSALGGIVDYQPQEFTLTVRAGTPLREVIDALAEQGQYLPFDPLLPDSASIGGTVASNLSGSRRHRFGGARDFVLGAAVVDGAGQAYTVGGKVVKNAAGFDLAKFLVGSLGRYAILTELTVKVFPDVPQFRSLRFRYANLADALTASYAINSSHFDLDALDILPGADGAAVLARLGGFSDSLPARAERFRDFVAKTTAPQHIEGSKDELSLWDCVAGLGGACLAKVTLAPRQLLALDAAVDKAQRRYILAGNIAFVACEDADWLGDALAGLGLRGLLLRGGARSPLLGAPLENVLAARVKATLDPLGKLV
ncbi:MAG: FAD-binding protein [Chloroflexi bacterium]|nr:FAD-binding protein [Chloroflexota bacterium]MCY4246503.1 FAD-binding protein [Chloroflexota bacterium]